MFIFPPLLKKKEDFKKIAYISIGISCFFLFLAVTSLLLLFSFIISSENLLSIYLVTRIIEFGRFLQRIDVLFMLIWILAIFSYVCITLSYSLYAFKKAIKSKHSNGLIYAFTAIIFATSLIDQNIAYSRFVETVAYKYIVLGVVFGLGFLILILANIKYRKKHKVKKLGGDVENAQAV